MTTNLEHGQQPLDQLMQDHGLSNKELAQAGGTAVTFKVVKKARNGRRLTKRMQMKVLDAVNACLQTPVSMQDVFNYRG